MKKPLKIVHLSGFNPNKPPQHPAKDDDYYFVASWAGLIARRLKYFKPELDIEVWRIEKGFDKKVDKIIFGLKGVIWPYKKILFKNLFTIDMAKKLNNLKKEHFIILHYHNVFNIRFIILIKLLCPKVKIVLSHHGGIPPKNKSLEDRLIKLFYMSKWIKCLTYLTDITKNYFLSINNHPSIKFLPVGADFNVFNPDDLQANRAKLSLDPHKIYAIYVGNFYKFKSVDLVLKVYFELKEKYNFSVIFVGGAKNCQNDLYEEVAKSGCPYFETQNWLDMPRFYNSADFYIHPAFNPDFGGLDVSWMEALACQKPVLSPQLSHLDFDYSELGVYLKDKSELINKTEWMINNYKTFKRCREVAQKHLDGNTAIMEKLARIYEEIYC